VWQLFTDVSEQRIRLIFNGQESEDPWRWDRYVVPKRR
jgi:hypothetical protein